MTGHQDVGLSIECALTKLQLTNFGTCPRRSMACEQVVQQRHCIRWRCLAVDERAPPQLRTVGQREMRFVQHVHRHHVDIMNYVYDISAGRKWSQNRKDSAIDD